MLGYSLNVKTVVFENNFWRVWLPSDGLVFLISFEYHFSKKCIEIRRKTSVIYKMLSDDFQTNKVHPT